MIAKRVLMALFVAVVMVLAGRTAKAECSDFVEFDMNCTGAGGCTGEWVDTLCTFGCYPADCVVDGGSIPCCGRRHDYDVFGDCTGNCDCSGIECGNARRRVHVRSAQINPEHRAELLQGYAPGLAMLGADLSYRPPQLINVFSRCSHKYELTVMSGKIIVTGGGM
jgi:hypothetical protein